MRIRFPFFLLVSITLFALFLYNPGLEDFDTYLANRSNSVAHAEVGNNAEVQVLFGLSSDVATSKVDREDYFIFSTYTYTKGKKKQQFLGLGRMFIELR